MMAAAHSSHLCTSLKIKREDARCSLHMSSGSKGLQVLKTVKDSCSHLGLIFLLPVQSDTTSLDLLKKKSRDHPDVEFLEQDILLC